MNRTTYSVVFIVSALIAAPVPAAGQPSSPDSEAVEVRRGDAPSTIISHHHASTALEGYLRGLADYRRAQNEGLVQAAEADLINEAVREQAIGNDDLYIHTKIAQKQARDLRRRQHTRALAAANARRAEARRAAILTGACELLRSARYDVYEWPEAFNNPAFSGQVERIESLLQRWPQDVVEPSPGERHTLAALARDLREGIQENRGCAQFSDRVKALQTVKQLELLVSLDYADLREANSAVKAQQVVANR